MTDKLKFELMDCEHNVAVEHFNVEEAISSIYVMIVNIVSQAEIIVTDVLKKEAFLTIIGKNENRYFHGIVNNFMKIGQSGSLFSYQVSVVPRIWLLNLNKNYTIFQDATVVDIVKQIFDRNYISCEEYSFKLESKY